MTRRTTFELTEEQWQALQAAMEKYDRSQSYLVRKAIELVYVLNLVDITGMPQEVDEIAV